MFGHSSPINQQWLCERGVAHFLGSYVCWDRDLTFSAVIFVLNTPDAGNGQAGSLRIFLIGFCPLPILMVQPSMFPFRRKYHCPSYLSSRRWEQPAVSKNKIARPLPESPRFLLSLVHSDSRRKVTWSLIFCCIYIVMGSRFVTPSCRDSNACDTLSGGKTCALFRGGGSITGQRIVIQLICKAVTFRYALIKDWETWPLESVRPVPCFEVVVWSRGNILFSKPRQIFRMTPCFGAS